MKEECDILVWRGNWADWLKSELVFIILLFMNVWFINTWKEISQMICFDTNTFCVYVFDIMEGRGASLKIRIIIEECFYHWTKLSRAEWDHSASHLLAVNILAREREREKEREREEERERDVTEVGTGLGLGREICCYDEIHSPSQTSGSSVVQERPGSITQSLSSLV